MLVSDVVDGPEGDGLVVFAHACPAPGDGVVIVPLVHNLVSLPWNKWLYYPRKYVFFIPHLQQMTDSFLRWLIFCRLYRNLM